MFEYLSKQDETYNTYKQIVCVICFIPLLVSYAVFHYFWWPRYMDLRRPPPGED